MMITTLRASLLATLLCTAAVSVHGAPAYDFDEAQLEAVLADLVAWLPGEWSSFPQVWYDRHVTMPEEGEHEHWHRTFALIDAPQVGETVFYGQINLGGPDGPVLARSQVLYKAFIDIDKGTVTIHGQPVAEPERFVDLHRRPELWGSARMPDESALNCRFDWRRHGRQLVGTLDNIEPVEDATKAAGSCVYTARNGRPFLADAEWVLSPDELWLYDINMMGEVQFVGRKDRTHLRLYRATRYRCDIADGLGQRSVVGHDRGYTIPLHPSDDETVQLMLLRAWYPAAESGLADELRMLLPDADENASAVAPGAMSISVRRDGFSVSCTRAIPTAQ